MSDDGSDGGEVYEVEKILEKRMKKGKAEYLIKWKGSKIQLAVIIDYRHLLWCVSGYDDEAENTWEPVDNLDCDDKIQEFEKKHKVSLWLISTAFHKPKKASVEKEQFII